MKKLYHVYGPEIVCVFTLGNQNKQKNIILLGEDHGDYVPKCRQRKNCLTVLDLIKMVKQADVFLESAWVSKDLKLAYKQGKIENYDSQLGVIKKTFHKELYGHNQQQTSTRFHFTDIRREPNLIQLLSIVYSKQNNIEDDLVMVLNTVFHFSTPTKFVDYINACVISNNYSKSIKGIFGKYAKFYIVKESLTSIPPKKRRVVHRIKKQIEKLPKDIQTVLLKYHDDKLNTMRSKPFFKEYEKNREQAFDDENIKSHHLGSVLHMFRYTLLHLMDIYHLARMLHYMDKSINIISYTGSDHTHNYMEFFEKYMGLKLAYIDDKSNQEKGNGYPLGVKIPKFYINV